jgi:hypothetical protein
VDPALAGQLQEAFRKASTPPPTPKATVPAPAVGPTKAKK